MEQETMLKEILNALKAHGEHVDRRLEQLESEMREGFERVSRMEIEMKEGFERVSRMETEMTEGFERVDEQLEHLGKKSDGLRADFHDTQGNVNYLLTKNAQHEEKLHELSNRRL